MTNLERRDRRRARRICESFPREAVDVTRACLADLVPIIAAALKREREEAGFAAVNYFFARKADREKARAAILGEQKKGKR